LIDRWLGEQILLVLYRLMIQIILTYNFLQIQCLSPAFGESLTYGLLKQLILPHSLIYYIALVLLLICIIIAIYAIQFRRIRRVLMEKEEALKLIGIQKIELEFREKGITDSLVYAKRIQEALLPSELYFRKHFQESFIFFKPKDIVSGDFYWIGEKNERVFIVAADCTGHGVPGALLSMIGREIIEKTINEEHIVAPSQVLAVLDKSLEKTFSREKNVGAVIRDGMDLGLCVVDKRRRVLSFSGAFFPLYLIRDNSLTEIKGDRIVLGMNPDGIRYSDNELDENYTLRIEGPYKYSRHPIYFFSIIFLLFRAEMSLFYLTMFISFTAYFYIGSYYEEKKMVRLFGDDYKDYQKKVSRIFPHKI